MATGWFKLKSVTERFCFTPQRMCADGNMCSEAVLKLRIFGFLCYIHSYCENVEQSYLGPGKSESCFRHGTHLQPDVEAGQWIELNMLKKGFSLHMSSREFLELLHWKSTGAWLCGLMLHLCLMGITVRTVQGNRLEIYFNSSEAIKAF